MRTKDYVTRDTLDRKHVYLANIASYIKSDKIRIPIWPREFSHDTYVRHPNNDEIFPVEL